MIMVVFGIEPIFMQKKVNKFKNEYASELARTPVLKALDVRHELHKIESSRYEGMAAS